MYNIRQADFLFTLFLFFLIYPVFSSDFDLWLGE